MYSWRYLTLFLAFVLATVAQVGAFVVPASQVATLSATTTTMTKSVTVAPMMMPEATSASTMNVAVDTVDPTNFLTDVLGGVLGTPLILAIPIVAALGVAGLVVFLIVSYANPAEDDDE